MELQQLANTLADVLKNKKLVTAESCTGGGLSFYITSTAGSSAYFDRAFITYSNQAKIDMLSVNKNTLDKFGAVSEETAVAMANGALHKSKADIAISITGVAGPDGGSKDKPVGTIWIGVATKNITKAFNHFFTGNREAIRLQTIQQALELIKTYA